MTPWGFQKSSCQTFWSAVKAGPKSSCQTSGRQSWKFGAYGSRRTCDSAELVAGWPTVVVAHSPAALAVGKRQGNRDLNKGKWKNVVLEELRSKGKIDIARRLRKETSASNPWIADRLNMGHPSRVGLNLGSR